MKLKIKKAYLYFFFFLFSVVTYILIFNVSIGIINKINHTITSFLESGEETNISLRFKTWNLIFSSYSLYPAFLLLGYGYNSENFSHYLSKTNYYYFGYDSYASVPENLFLMFLSYGGIFAFLTLLLFFVILLYQTYLARNRSLLAKLLYFLSVSLFLTNNTGGSLLSDLFLTQFGLVYFWILINDAKNQHTIYYGKK
jgi:O-antigen ligase